MLNYLKTPNSSKTLFENTNFEYNKEENLQENGNKSNDNNSFKLPSSKQNLNSNFANRTGSISNLIKQQEKEIINNKNIFDKKSLDKQKLSLIELVRNGSINLEKTATIKENNNNEAKNSNDNQDKK